MLQNLEFPGSRWTWCRPGLEDILKVRSAPGEFPPQSDARCGPCRDKHRRFSVLDHDSTTNWLLAAASYFCDDYSRMADGAAARLYLTLTQLSSGHESSSDLAPNNTFIALVALCPFGRSNVLTPLESLTTTCDTRKAEYSSGN